MKTIITIISTILLCTLKMSGQMIVNDPTANTLQTKNNVLHAENVAKNTAILEKAKSSYKALQKMQKTYDKWSDNIEKVANTIETGNEARKVGKMLENIKDNFEQGIGGANSNMYLSRNDHLRVIYVYKTILNDCLSIASESIDYITQGKYKMNDAGRLEFLKSNNVKLQEKLALLVYMNKKMKYAEDKTKSELAAKEFFSVKKPTY